MPKLIPVQSSNIAGVHYDADARVMTVRFHSGVGTVDTLTGRGRTYAYPEISPELFMACMAAPSIGSFVARHIKGAQGQPFVQLRDAAADAFTLGEPAAGAGDRALARKQWGADLLIEYGIPSTLHGGLIRYVQDHLRPGGFLCAILENDLQHAFLRADGLINELAIGKIMRFLTYECPAPCYGSRANVDAWCDARGRDAD